MYRVMYQNNDTYHLYQGHEVLPMEIYATKGFCRPQSYNPLMSLISTGSLQLGWPPKYLHIL